MPSRQEFQTVGIMVLVTKNGDIQRHRAGWRRLFFTTLLGLSLLVTTTTLFFVNPALLVVQHQLRLQNGSMLCELLLSRFTSTKMYLYLFNVTNAERFISGADQKVKLQEIGPFVYQEYRTNEDVEINKDPGIMRYTPKLEKVFIPEESIGDPKDFNVTVPNIAMLASTALISKYPFVVRQIFNILAASHQMQAFVQLTAFQHIWGFPHPLIKLANRVVPGLIYFKSVGLFERMYDIDVDYRMEIGTSDADKFKVEKVTKIQPKNKKTDAKALIDNMFTFNDSYEGAAFPLNLTPETPIHIYRHGLCKTFHIQHVGSRQMSYGGVGFAYHFHNDTFRDRKQCDTKGWCPEGLMDLSDCFFGFPVVLSKSHFLDSDPRLLDMVEGLKPDRNIHDTQIILDPKISAGVSGSMALQISLFLTDVGYNPETRRLKDIVLPVSNIIAKAPPLIEEVRSVLELLYTRGPYIMATVQVVCTLLGLLLLSYSARMLYWSWLAKKESQRKHLKRTCLPNGVNC